MLRKIPNEMEYTEEALADHRRWLEDFVFKGRTLRGLLLAEVSVLFENRGLTTDPIDFVNAVPIEEVSDLFPDFWAWPEGQPWYEVEDALDLWSNLIQAVEALTGGEA